MVGEVKEQDDPHYRYTLTSPHLLRWQSSRWVPFLHSIEKRCIISIIKNGIIESQVEFLLNIMDSHCMDPSSRI